MKGNVMRWTVAMIVLLAQLAPLSAMEVKVDRDQLILSGPVINGDFAKVEQGLASGVVKTVILRNSPGGDIPTGFNVGNLLRRRGLATAVSGFCHSSCSRMFLGGVRRAFTDDFPADETQVGFHGHYDDNGNLNAQMVARTGLKAWIIAHSDGKADPALVERWIKIPRKIGMMHFYHPERGRRNGASTFLCQGTEQSRDVFDCEAINRTGLDLGIITSLEIVHANDQAVLRSTRTERPSPTHFADLKDVGRVPVIARGKTEYERFLRAAYPRAYALAPDGNNWKWVSGGRAIDQALTECGQRAHRPCRLYAVNGDVVWVK
jgi:hypothetical protein